MTNKEFESSKKKWLNDPILKDLSKPLKEKYLQQVSELKNHHYKLIGYGSLLNINDVYRTSPNLIKHEVGYIHGWERIFNMGSNASGSYLNVQRSNTTNMIVALLTIPVKDMPNIILREINYTFINVNCETSTEEVEALMVYGNDTINHCIDPQLNYLHLCIQGVGQLGGAAAIDNFIKTTKTNFGSLQEWLDTINLERLLRANTYISR